MNTLARSPDNIPDGELTAFPQCMPDDCKRSDPIEAYRAYYIQEKKYFAKWTKREIPAWFS